MLSTILLTLVTQGRSPFQAPQASVHYALDRQFDLTHYSVVLDVDYDKRAIKGTVTNFLRPLRGGLQSLTLHAGTDLKIVSVKVNGVDTAYSRIGEELRVAVSATKVTESLTIRVAYEASNQRGGGFGSEGGWHWIESDGTPERRGFWTQGESNYNRRWVPFWDYPNDFSTSETTVTVPAGWTVVGNGKLASQATAKNRSTFHWVMTQPHATYLLSLVGGPFDIQKEKWRDVDLWYVVPLGQGRLIPASFGDTKDMLEFFSNKVGVKYAWPKYAQNAMFDFGGGMENVSATTLGAGSLTDGRDDFRSMSSLNSHELGHQWFGDLVSCKDWGQTWLNEGFATFMQWIYFEHAQGANGYAREVASGMGSYLAEARRYKRPLATNFYSDADAMFDSHSYPKGGSVIHTLRRQLGDAAFFAGLKRYLNTCRHQPVESWDLCRGITEGSGVNVQKFFEQWVYKPGHPVLEYSWNTIPTGVEIVVKQTQDTSDGTPIYEIPAKVGIISAGKMTLKAITLTTAEDTIPIPFSGKVDAVILDPNQDFLREMKHSFRDDELPFIARYGSNAPMRTQALDQLLRSASEETIKMAVELYSADQSQFPVFPSTSRLANLERPELRSFFRNELKHLDFGRRGDAARALLALENNEEDAKRIAAMVTPTQCYPVIRAALQRLDFEKHRGAFVVSATMPCRDEGLRRTALRALAEKGNASERAIVVKQATVAGEARVTATGVLGYLPKELAREALKRALSDASQPLIMAALSAIRENKDSALKGAVEAVTKRQLPTRILNSAKQTLTAISETP